MGCVLALVALAVVGPIALMIILMASGAQAASCAPPRPVDAAVARALAADGRPIVLADIADNTGGGAAGDTTEILRELLRVGATETTVACIWDPQAAAACVAAGVGATLTVEVGGKIDPSHGAPLALTGRVRAVSDGRFVYKGPMMRGLAGRLGPTAVLEVGGVKVIVSET